MRNVFLAIILLFTSCASNNIVTELSIPKPGSLNGYSSIDDVKRTHFVTDAYNAIYDIPVIAGHTWFGKPFVSGVNFWSSFASIILFNGGGLKVILPRERLYSKTGLETIIHEFAHHLDVMDRAGLGEFIDHEEFEAVLHRLLEDEKHKKFAEDVMESSDWFVTNIFGIGHLAEEIAYTADKLIVDGGPDCMWHVFRNMLIRNGSTN
jgi:hypothetical protein